jgi:hypothetical protein
VKVRDPLLGSQAAVLEMETELLAVDKGVRVTCICPAGVVVPLSPVKEMLVDTVDRMFPDKIRQVVYRGTLLERVMVRVFWSQGFGLLWLMFEMIQLA